MGPRRGGITNAHAGLIIYSTLASTIVAVLLLTNWPTYDHLMRGGPPLLMYYAVPGLLILPIVFSQPELFVRFTKEALFWWLVIYLLSGVVWLLLTQEFMDESIAQWRTRLSAFGLFYTITILTSEARRRVLGVVIVGCIVVACANTWFDVLRPNRFVPLALEFAHPGRGAGFFINPNIAASFIAMATIVALPFIAMRFRGALILCAVVGIVPTFSRSGYLYAALILIGPILLKLLSRFQVGFIVVAAPALVVAATMSYDFLMYSSDDTNVHNVVRRLEWFQGLREEDEAVEGRIYGAEQAWKMFVDEPLIGRGPGATRVEALVQEAPHNMYLMFMAEQGFLGLALYLSLIGIMARRGWQLARTAIDQEGRDIGKAMLLYAIFLFAYGFFSHNVLEEPHGMFAIAFIVAAAFRASRVAPVWASTPVPDFPHRQPRANVTRRLGQS